MEEGGLRRGRTGGGGAVKQGANPFREHCRVTAARQMAVGLGFLGALDVKVGDKAPRQLIYVPQFEYLMAAGSALGQGYGAQGAGLELPAPGSKLEIVVAAEQMKLRAVNQMARNEHSFFSWIDGRFPSAGEKDMADLSAQDRSEVDALIATGSKGDAIKRVCEVTDMDLKAAKALVNARERELRHLPPRQVSAASKKKGCLGVVVLLAVGAAAGLWRWW